LSWALVDWLLITAVLALATVFVAGLGTARSERTLTDFLLLGALVVSLQSFVGNSGIVSFGHVAFVGVGAYVAALVTISPVIKEQALAELPRFLAQAEIGLVPAALLGALAAAVLAALIGGAISRMSELGMAVATLALLVFVHTVLSSWDSVTRGGYGIFGIPSRASVWVGLATVLIAVLIAILYRASQPGLRLQAAREDPLSAMAVGVNVAGERFWGFVLSAAMMGAGGAILAQHLLAFDPDQFYFALTFTTLSMLVIGGRESVTGALVGTALIVVVSDSLRRFEGGFFIGTLEVPELRGLVQLTIAVLIILVLVFRPEGIAGRWELSDLYPRGLGGAGSKRRRSGTRSPTRRVGPASGEAPPALEVVDLRMDFVGLRALHDVSLSVAPGEILGLIGPNGSGKTTLLNVTSGVFNPVAGRVLLEGEDITGLPSFRIARHGLARTFQTIRLFPGLTVRENVTAAVSGRVDDDEVHRFLEIFDLTEHEDDLAGTLAYGEQRRVEAARSSIRRPHVLLLDEPAAGMNEQESDRLVEIITRVRDELGCAMIVIDHDLRLILRLSNRVHVLNEGRTIADGDPQSIATDRQVVEAYLGTRAGA
jgi:branched-chain amino acid transport system permease protein